jgi:SAM-dependent methyltransferase
MNRAHRWLCRSAYWKDTVRTSLLPWALEGVDLGAEVLEVGPGPGVTTDLLRARAARLTCVEIDAALAGSLARRMAGGNVRVLHADATAMSFENAAFDGAVSFTMLHHVPSPALQDRLLAEVARVLRPGAIFAGTDSVYSFRFRLLHIGDDMTLVDPKTFPRRLEAAGFTDARVDVGKARFRFRARRAGG